MDIHGPVLLVGDRLPDVADELSSKGIDAIEWSRRAFHGTPATAWPPSGPFGTVAVRLPRSKEELSMVLHAGARALKPGGTSMVYGAKDEGIGSVHRVLDELHENIEVVGVGGHCRVLRAGVKSNLSGLRGSLDEWREEVSLGHNGLKEPWVSYPGVFAHGRLDPGTRLLLNALPDLGPRASVLDYGCGSGVVGAAVRAAHPQVRLTLLDIDAVALEAAAENVPGAEYLLRDGLPDRGPERYDAILSNPPFHEGKREEPTMILELVRGAPGLLLPSGCLVVVAQKRLPLEEVFTGSFGTVTIPSEGGGFRVWEGRTPRSPG
jgi:16S rRNA (guanine1207-N2)-methyltransferase